MATQHAQTSNWRNELLPNVVDHLAKITPSAPYALYPNSPTTYDEGYRTVTYKDFANAINGFAWWLSETLGAPQNFDVVAYVGPNDVRYTALLLGAIKAGYVAFFTSPRNSIAAHGALFDELKCRIMLTPSPAPPAVEHILSAHPMKHFQVPSVEELLEKDYPHYPYHKKFGQSRMEPLVMLHTSGSTGIPKPLIWSHETAARHSNFCASEPPTGYQSIDKLHQGKRMLNTFPPFHAACVAIHIVHSIPFGTISIAPLSGAIPTAEGVVQALEHTDAEAAFLVPSIVSDLGQKREMLDRCSKQLKLVLYAGGDLPQSIGDKVAEKLHIRCNYGASEFGLACQLIAPGMTRNDWHYVCFHPNLGLAFEEVTPGMFELIVKRDPKYEANQLAFSIGPSMQDLKEYRTRDLFVKHPTIPDCWGWRARADDIIVFLNGEKTNPVSMEQYVMGKNPNVAAVLVVGMQRFQASLLVEPAAPLGKLGPDQVATFIDEIWTSVDEANKVAPAHARVEKSMILLTTPDKPMIRSGKGTIQRQGTVSQYEAEINELYLKADTDLSGAEQASVNAKDANQVSEFLKRAIANIEPDLLQEGESFFTLGMDSLMAIRIMRALRHALGRPELEVSVVYNNPSLQALTRYIVGDNAATEAVTNNCTDGVKQMSEMESVFQEYKGKIDIPQSPLKSSPETVILTGSTGSLGTHLLEALLINPKITHIYCLNRRANAEEIHREKAKTTDFPFDNHTHRITFLHATLDQPNLGLSNEIYEQMSSTATLIIHNAWPVNFMVPLKTFRPQFEGLTNLFHFASTSTNKPKMLYISSISSVAQLPRASPSSPIPEELIEDFDAPYAIGYAKSKLLAELLCDNAAKQLGIPVSVARVGQIAGPVLSKTCTLWNTAEWLPSLVLTSISMRALPDDLGAELNKIDWVPVDMLAQVLVELGMGSTPSGGASGAQVLNVLNPRATSWEEVLPVLVASIERHVGKGVQVVPMAEWLDRLGGIAEGFEAEATDLVRMYPAIKLQEFYEARMRNSGHANEWEMGRAVGRSATLKGMPAVGSGWIEKWVDGWVNQAN